MEQKQLTGLVKQAQHGSAEAFGLLYEEYSRELYRFALWYLHNEADAEDAVQDACLQAYKKIKQLRKAEMFRSWFFKILANECKDKLAVSKKSSENIIPEDIDILENIPDENSEKSVSALETGELIEALPEPEKSIVLMSVIAGFTSKEIGKLLKLNASTVRSKLSRALADLRARLESEQESAAK